MKQGKDVQDATSLPALGLEAVGIRLPCVPAACSFRPLFFKGRGLLGLWGPMLFTFSGLRHESISYSFWLF